MERGACVTLIGSNGAGETDNSLSDLRAYPNIQRRDTWSMDPQLVDMQQREENSRRQLSAGRT